MFYSMQKTGQAEEAIRRLGLSLAAGFVVAGVYVIGMGRRREESATLPTTLVLLTVVMTPLFLTRVLHPERPPAAEPGAAQPVAGAVPAA